MSKISEYLSEHILGEVSTQKAILGQFSHDGSVLSLTPQAVIFPRNTQDLRKVAKFCWQLAEKGHILPLTMRGFGADASGASIGSGLVINTTAHLNQILELPLKSKDQQIHVQAGIDAATVNNVLYWHNLTVPAFPKSARNSSLGAIIANSSRGPLSGKYGGIDQWVDRLEVVLANGDVIETGRISKRELSKKIGLQTFEGEIYRKLDSLIEDYEAHLTRELAGKPYGNSGYGNIVDVKAKDGSFDLTPLFIGSQGTLGIISEAILKTTSSNSSVDKILIVANSMDEARDYCDEIIKYEPSQLEIIDGRLYEMAKNLGKRYPFFNRPDDSLVVGAIMQVEFDDAKDHARSKKIKKIKKMLKESTAEIITSENSSPNEIDAITDVLTSVLLTEYDNFSFPPILDGAQIGNDRIDEFLLELKKLEDKHHVSLPVRIRVLDGVVYARTPFELHKVIDKQKLFKLIADYAVMVDACHGVFIVDSGEGRLKANAARAVIDDTSLRLFEDIRNIFDPYHFLNPGVKEQVAFKDLVSMLRNDYNVASHAHLAPNS